MFPPDVYQAEKKFLWGLCYRMTANAADAEDIVQETFVRAMERPPQNTSDPWRPWLISVAMNLSRDHLRWRRRRDYKGSWLPTPVLTEGQDEDILFELPPDSSQSPAARYDLTESISLAFLVALEALTPMQRAVLLLRDVFDYSTLETAEVLKTSEANVKVVLHRARRAMQEYDHKRLPVPQARQKVTQTTLERFVQCLALRDAAGLEQLLTEGVVTFSDGGGEVPAAFAPIRGRDRVLRFFMALTNVQVTEPPTVSFQLVNGLPALVVQYAKPQPNRAQRFVLQCDVNETGQIVQIHSILAPSKLKAVFGK